MFSSVEDPWTYSKTTKTFTPLPISLFWNLFIRSYPLFHCQLNPIFYVLIEIRVEKYSNEKHDTQYSIFIFVWGGSLSRLLLFFDWHALDGILIATSLSLCPPHFFKPFMANVSSKVWQNLVQIISTLFTNIMCRLMRSRLYSPIVFSRFPYWYTRPSID